MCSNYPKESLKDFLACHGRYDLTPFQPVSKYRECSIISQELINSYIEGFVNFLKTHSDDEVFSEVIIPRDRCQTFDKSVFNRLTINIISKNGWSFTTDEGAFNMHIPYEFIQDYAKKANFVYPHRIAIYFYSYILKRIFREKYDLQDYYDCDGPWGMTSGGDGYEITLYYK